MKKKYISPEVFCQQIHFDNLLNNGSLNVDKGDLDHQVDTGGEAGNGQGSDGRRHGRNTWEDFDDEEDEDY